MVKNLHSRLANLELVIAKKRDRPEMYIFELENEWDIVLAHDVGEAWTVVDKYRDRIVSVTGGIYAPMMLNVVHPAPDRRLADFE